MNIAIISNPESPNTADLIAAATSAGAQTTVFALKDLALAVESLDDHSFFSQDVYVFRGYNKNFLFARSLAQELVRRGKLVIDERLANTLIPSKFHEALVYASIGARHIPTYSAQNFDALKESGFSGQYPVVVKEVDSQKGKGVRLCQDEPTLRDEMKRHGHAIIVQDFVEIAYDLRVICVGDKAIGAIKRESSDDDFRTNVSLGGTATPYTLSDEESALALKAHRAFGYDVSGVDLGHAASGEPFIIETNIAPEWQGFKEATGIDVATEIMTYIQERYSAHGSEV